jgi:hypothetical protein
MRSSILTISFIWLFAAGLASAQGKPDRKAREEAKKHFALGKQLYEAGKYEDAIREFHMANDLAPSPRVLFNIAQSYRLMGDKRNAKQYYEQFLAAERNGQIADEARSHLEVLTKAIADEEEEARRKAEEETRRLEEERKKAEAERQRVEDERQKAEEDARRRAAEDEARRRAAEEERLRLAEERRRLEASRGGRPQTPLQKVLRWGGLGLGVIGAGALTYGVYKGSEASRMERDLEDQVRVDGRYPDDIVARMSAGNRAESRAIFGMIAGGIGVLTGGVLFYLGGHVDVEPAVTESGAGAILRGSF